MQQNLQASRLLFANLFDYAGLFPPAQLPLETAVRKYFQHSSSTVDWMVKNFVCPVSRVRELGELLHIFHEHTEPVGMTVLPSYDENPEKNLATQVKDLVLLHQFLTEMGERVRINQFEMKLPLFDRIDASNELLQRYLNEIKRMYSAFLDKGAMVFFEVPWQEKMGSQVSAISRVFESFLSNTGQPLFGIKLRFGGQSPEAYPAPELVADAIRELAQTLVPWKGTAGLHHPLHHFNEQAGMKMHGFMNLIVADMIARNGEGTVNDLITILTDEDPENFKMSEDEIRWREKSFDPASIQNTRTNGFLSIGSCSIDEPVEDLTELNYL